MEERVLKRIATICATIMLMITSGSFIWNIDFSCTNAVTPRKKEAFAVNLDITSTPDGGSLGHNLKESTAENLSRALNISTMLNYEDNILQPRARQTCDSEKLEIDDELLNQLGDTFIVMKKVYGSDRKVSFFDNYVTRELTIQLDGMYQCNYASENIFRYYKNEIFHGNPDYVSSYVLEENDEGVLEEVEIKDYGKEFVHNIEIEYHFDENSLMYSAAVKLSMDHVYEYTLYEDENAYYISCVRPRELYDKIIVIDAGHGGKDAGSVSMDRTVYEKDINIALVSLLKKQLEDTDIKVYYTRIQDEKVFLKPRVYLANDLEADFFISVHCNSSTSAMPKGTEVLCYDTTVKGVRSLDLANIFLEEICNATSLDNRGIIRMKKDDIFILENATVPTILIETGFLSNTSDLEYLLDDHNSYKVAEGIYKGIIRSYDELR